MLAALEGYKITGKRQFAKASTAVSIVLAPRRAELYISDGAL